MSDDLDRYRQQAREAKGRARTGLPLSPVAVTRLADAVLSLADTVERQRAVLDAMELLMTKAAAFLPGWMLSDFAEIVAGPSPPPTTEPTEKNDG